MAETEEKNPFRRLKSRSLLWWCLASLPVVVMLAPDQALAGFTVYLVILLWAVWQFHRLGIDSRRIVGTLSRDSVWIPVIAAAVPAVLVFATGQWVLFLWFTSLVAPSAGRAVQEMVRQADLSRIPWVVIVLVAPPIEELLFRGILLHRWSVKWGLRRAVLFSSLAFAVLHVNPVGVFVFGCLMAVLYIRSRTLVVPIICHIVNNAVAFSLTDLSFLASSLPRVILCTAASGVGIAWFLFKSWPRPGEPAPYFAPAPAPETEPSDQPPCDPPAPEGFSD